MSWHEDIDINRLELFESADPVLYVSVKQRRHHAIDQNIARNKYFIVRKMDKYITHRVRPLRDPEYERDTV